MSERRISITDFDRKRLEELIRVAEDFGSRVRKDLGALAHELAEAEIVASKEIPRDVVTMNSKVLLLDLDSGEQMDFVLVFPQDADADLGKISVLAPIGTAILGYSKGSTVEWPVPSGIRRIRIEEILYQPEAAGDFHL
jgi:regulator of nucleoside diphosphate kinase